MRPTWSRRYVCERRRESSPPPTVSSPPASPSADYLVRHAGAEAERIAVIPCGVDTELFTPGDAEEARAALGFAAGPLVLYVGRLAPIKGLETLLDAIALLARRGRPLRLVIVGGEADEPPEGHEG